MTPNPRICTRRGCPKAIDWRKSARALYCDDCAAESHSRRWHHRKHKGRRAELHPINLGRPFAFQAVRDRVPQLDPIRGFEPWRRYLADRMIAADSSLTYQTATQRVQRANRRKFLTWVEADSFATVLGCHPAELWDNWHDEMARLDLEGAAA